MYQRKKTNVLKFGNGVAASKNEIHANAAPLGGDEQVTSRAETLIPAASSTSAITRFISDESAKEGKTRFCPID